MLDHYYAAIKFPRKLIIASRYKLFWKNKFINTCILDKEILKILCLE